MVISFNRLGNIVFQLRLHSSITQICVVGLSDHAFIFNIELGYNI